MAEVTGTVTSGGGMTITQIWFSFEGRISRSMFWLKYFLPWVGLNIVAAIVDAAIGAPVAQIAVALVGLWVGLAAGAKRCHDRNRSGWFQAIVLIPIIGALWLLVELGFLKGTDGENRFGRDPLAG